MKPLLVTQFLILVTPVFAQAVNTVIHALWNHATRGGAHLGSIIVSFLVGFVVQGAVAISILKSYPTTSEEWAGALLWSAVTYAGFGFCYFTFVNLARTSLRIRILSELLQAQDHTLNAQQLGHIYDDDEVAQVRLQRLEQWGQIERQGDRLLPAGRAFWLLGLMVQAVRRTMGVVPRGSKVRPPHSS